MSRLPLIVVVIALFPVLAFAQEILQADSGSWYLDPAQPVRLHKASFEIYHEVDDMHFHGTISFEPVLRFSGSSEEGHLDVELNGKGEVLDETELGNRVWLGYRFARQALDYPEHGITKVRAIFDRGEGVSVGSTSFTIPKGAKRLEMLEVVWEGGEDLPITKTIRWGRTGFPWIPIAAVAVAAGTTAALWRRQRRQKRGHQGSAVSGALARIDGKPLSGIQVSLSKGGENLTVTSDADGQYRFLNVKPGTYQLTVQTIGFAHVQEEVNVTEEQDL